MNFKTNLLFIQMIIYFKEIKVQYTRNAKLTNIDGYSSDIALKME